MAAGGHFGWPKITFDRISNYLGLIRNFFFSQNGPRRAFCMTENHFRLHFSPFQINTQFFFFWILIFFFSKTASGHLAGPFGSWFLPKSIETSLYSRSVATSNMKLIGALLIKLWSAQAIFTNFGSSDFLQNRQGSSTLGHQWLCQIWIWYAHWCRSYVKQKHWRLAAAAASRPKS